MKSCFDIYAYLFVIQVSPQNIIYVREGTYSVIVSTNKFWVGHNLFHNKYLLFYWLLGLSLEVLLTSSVLLFSYWIFCFSFLDGSL